MESEVVESEAVKSEAVESEAVEVRLGKLQGVEALEGRSLERRKL